VDGVTVECRSAEGDIHGSREPAAGILQRLGGQRRVEPRERVAQPLRQDDLAIVCTFSE